MSKRSLVPALALLLVPLFAPPEAAALVSIERYCRNIERRILSHEQRAARRCDDFTGCTPAARRGFTRLETRFVARCVKLNQTQVLASHNSYHIRPHEPLWTVLLAFASIFYQIDYTHPALDVQFEERGIRAIELDVFADPAGGLYSVRHGLIATGEEPVSTIPELYLPGFKVMHLQDIDFESSCGYRFVDCLQQVKQWSDAHPTHLPIMIQVEAKDDVLPDPGLGFVIPIPIGTAQFDALDAEIRSVFPPEQLITPDDVRGTHATLEAAVLAGGWPTLGESRGKILFTLDNEGKRNAYLSGHPGLVGRVIFTNSFPGQADAAFVKRNNPQDASIPDLVRAGYIVRTRADADTEQARSGDTTDREAALDSGAHYVSTDYDVPDPAFGTGYFVEIPKGAPARCNPLNAPPGCRNAFLELPQQ